MKELTNKSRKLAYLLRHDREYAYDEHGYREVDDLVKNYGFTVDLLDTIVHENNKQRFEFNADKTKIRARQGHSVDVDVELKEMTPPDVLYHGTAAKFLEPIRQKGLIKGTRLHVHLSADIATAITVGRRHGDPVVLAIDAKSMAVDGFKFRHSNNGVWLVDSIPYKYITE